MTFKTKKIGALNHHAEFVELAQKLTRVHQLTKYSKLVFYITLNFEHSF